MYAISSGSLRSMVTKFECRKITTSLEIVFFCSNQQLYMYLRNLPCIYVGNLRIFLFDHEHYCLQHTSWSMVDRHVILVPHGAVHDLDCLAQLLACCTPCQATKSQNQRKSMLILGGSASCRPPFAFFGPIWTRIIAEAALTLRTLW